MPKLLTARERTARERTAETTRRILDFLFDRGIIAHRNNSLPIPVARMGVVTGFRPGSRSGRPDIEGILPPRGKSLLVEIKTGKDRLSDIQQAYLSQASAAGAVVVVAKDFEDFSRQWKDLGLSTEKRETLLDKSL